MRSLLSVTLDNLIGTGDYERRREGEGRTSAAAAALLLGHGKAAPAAAAGGAAGAAGDCCLACCFPRAGWGHCLPRLCVLLALCLNAVPRDYAKAETC